MDFKMKNESLFLDLIMFFQRNDGLSFAEKNRFLT